MVTHVSKTLNAWILFYKPWMATEDSYYKNLLKAKSGNTRNSFAKLKHPFRKANTGQKTLSYIGPSLWNNLPETMKKKKKKKRFKYFQTKCKKFLFKPVNRYYCHNDYLGLLSYYHYYCYYPQYYLTIRFLTNPV